MTTTIAVPRQEQQLRCSSAVQFIIAAEGNTQTPSQFRILFATGKPIANHWGWQNLVIDLDSVKIASQSMPLLLNHDERVGFTTKISRNAEGYFADGIWLANDQAKAVLADARAGFPFQSSCWLSPGRIEEVLQGTTVQVNGFALQGPGWIWRDCECREVTVTELGADKNTRLETLSQGHAPLQVPVLTSVGEKTMTTTQDGPMTVARLSELHPDLVKSVRESAFAEGKAAGLTEGQNAERKRTSQILKRSTASQFELAQQLITDGKDSETATDALLADPRRNVVETKLALAAAAPGVILPATESAKPNANETLQQRAEREFNTDPKIRETYSTAEHYRAFLQYAPEAKEN